jgi:CRISPR-associated protein Cmr4
VVVTELLLYLYAESPVHAGAADSSGAIDLPIQREATTGYPVIWGQSLKGALRQAAHQASWEDAVIRRVFGAAIGEPARDSRVNGAAPDASSAGETLAAVLPDDAGAGMLAVGDAQLVALPVPTLHGTFAWATSQIALARLTRKYAMLGRDGCPPVPDSPARGGGLAATADWIGPRREQVLGPCVVPVAGEADPSLGRWAGRLADDAIGEAPGMAPFAAKLRTDLILVGADVMPVLSRECTEISARVQLNDGKTVEHGPFYSEYLPVETIMAASLTLRERRDGSDTGDAEALSGLLAKAPLQLGGDETLGKGLVWPRVHMPERAGTS